MVVSSGPLEGVAVVVVVGQEMLPYSVLAEAVIALHTPEEGVRVYPQL